MHCLCIFISKHVLLKEAWQIWRQLLCDEKSLTEEPAGGCRCLPCIQTEQPWMCRTSSWAWWMLAWLLVTWSPLWKSFRSLFDTCNICNIHVDLALYPLYSFLPWLKGWSKPCKLEIEFSNESFMIFRQLAGLQWHKRFDRRWSAGYRASPEQQLVSPWQWKWQCRCKKWTWRWSCLECKSGMG